MTKKSDTVTISFQDAMKYREAFATCAIEGNEFAIHMLDLWKSDRQQYYKELAEFIVIGENND